MKAVIMAGGQGSRLRPLTNNRPKPMVPLVDRPVMAHTVGLLKRHGLDEIVDQFTLALGKATVGDAAVVYQGDGLSGRDDGPDVIGVSRQTEEVHLASTLASLADDLR